MRRLPRGRRGPAGDREGRDHRRQRRHRRKDDGKQRAESRAARQPVRQQSPAAGRRTTRQDGVRRHSSERHARRRNGVARLADRRPGWRHLDDPEVGGRAQPEWRQDLAGVRRRDAGSQGRGTRCVRRRHSLSRRLHQHHATARRRWPCLRPGGSRPEPPLSRHDRRADSRASEMASDGDVRHVLRRSARSLRKGLSRRQGCRRGEHPFTGAGAGGRPFVRTRSSANISAGCPARFRPVPCIDRSIRSAVGTAHAGRLESGRHPQA